ncbi:hypothetical protein Taro_020760 [Colocasia esculenta]|uniref:RING-type domain-containing protein n=1 Tax=Colocasia esculenta TaxID=4460 RepID=A0A843UX64_COLES|nr:hypothetical protein [Colocasia esculenta]
MDAHSTVLKTRAFLETTAVVTAASSYCLSESYEKSSVLVSIVGQGFPPGGSGIVTRKTEEGQAEYAPKWRFTDSETWNTCPVGKQILLQTQIAVICLRNAGYPDTRVTSMSWFGGAADLIGWPPVGRPRGARDCFSESYSGSDSNARSEIEIAAVLCPSFPFLHALPLLALPLLPPLWPLTAAAHPAMDLHLHVRSRPTLSLLHTHQPGRPPVVFLRLRLSEARAPLNSGASGDAAFQDVEVRLDREFMFKDLYEFLRPGKARRAVASMLAVSRSVWPVGERAFAVLVQRVSDDFTYSAAKAMSVPPCNVTGVVHIFRLPANHGTGGASNGGGLGRALLESREAHEREWGFGGLPASEAAMEELETAEYPGPKGEDRCIVCYEEFTPPQEVKRMPCGHLFHGDCIVQWLRRNHRCPLCRFEMPKGEAAPPS